MKHFCVQNKQKTKKKIMEKRKLKITLKVLHKVSVYFQETKQFIEENLEKKFVKENMSVEEVFYFLFTSLEAKS